MKNILNKIRIKFNVILTNFLSPIMVKTSLTSSLFYLLFSSKFRREEQAVLAGRLKHLDESINNKSNLFVLIRNIHRIEKGLLMRPRRDLFALDFIQETMDKFEKMYDPKFLTQNSQIKWANDVLYEYFKKSGSHPILDKERDRFNILSQSYVDATNIKSIPYMRIISQRPNLTYDDFFKLVKYRRSVRWFLQKKVSHELVDNAILAAIQSPSACNRQPFEYRIIDDPKILKEVVDIPMGIKGYQDNIPMMVVVIGNLDAYFDERDRHVIYIDASLANMSFMLALEVQGLSSCSINWPDIEKLERRMSKALSLEIHQRPIMCMAVGYPDPNGLVAYSEKRSLDEIRKYN